MTTQSFLPAPQVLHGSRLGSKGFVECRVSALYARLEMMCETGLGEIWRGSAGRIVKARALQKTKRIWFFCTLQRHWGPAGIWSRCPSFHAGLWGDLHLSRLKTKGPLKSSFISLKSLHPFIHFARKEGRSASSRCGVSRLGGGGF